jgi:predicted nucleotidyltransferase component of viral defense system
VRLRQRPDDLLALTAATADALAIPAEFVEKDFWVVELLRSLFQPSDVSADVTIVFKGGTSLSKGFGLTQRFSEDVDSHDGNRVGDRLAGLTPKLTGSMSMPWL